MKKRRKQLDEDDRSFLQVDKDLLDEALEEQAELFGEWATKLAEAKMDLDEMEDEFEAIKAELDNAIREDPKKFGFKVKEGKGPTEPAIKNKIIVCDEYQKAAKQIRVAKFRVNSIDAMVKALDHRKRALEKLTDLHGQNYFASPRAKRGDDDGPVRARRRRIEQEEGNE